MQRKAPIDILVDATGGGRPPDRRRTLSRAIIGFLGFFFVIFLIYTVFPSSSDTLSGNEAERTQDLSYWGSRNSPAGLNPNEASLTPGSSSSSLTRSLALKEPLSDISNLKIYIYGDELFDNPIWRDDVVQCYDEFLSMDRSSGLNETGGLGKRISIFSKTGVQLWDTDPYALEVIVYNRLMNSHFRTLNPEEADLFYIPYYVGIAWRCSLVSSRMPLPYNDDAVNAQLWNKLRHSTSSFFKQSVKTHFIVSARPISDISASFVDAGSSHPYFLASPDSSGFTRSTGGAVPLTLPIPSGIHLASATSVSVPKKLLSLGPREFLSAFIGDRNGPLRSKISKMCENHRSSCYHEPFNSTHPTEAEYVSAAFARSRATFCLEPHYGGQVLKNHRGLWDSLSQGCVPVVFGEDSLEQLPFQTQIDWRKILVIVPEDVDDVVEHLKKIPPATVEAMLREVICLLRHVQYSSFDDDEDALSLLLREIVRLQTA